MLRFAINPAQDMSIDDLKIALLNYLVALRQGEEFILRICDLDNTQEVEKRAQEIPSLLALFGIEATQVVYQSQNIRFHSAMALQLLHEKKAFSCFCSDAWIEKKKNEAEDKNVPYYYDDACRNLPAELVIDNTAPFNIRIIRPQNSFVVHDVFKGEIEVQPQSMDSFIIMNQRKEPTQDFATAVDDMLQDISFVVANKISLQNTQKQVHIRSTLGYDKEVHYAHIVSFTEDQNISIKALLEEGFLPEAILNYIISIWLTPEGKQAVSFQDVKSSFDIHTISQKPQPFDKKILQQMNQEYLYAMDAKELSRYVGFADEDIGRLAKLYLKDCVTTQELKTKISPIFQRKNIPEKLQEEVNVLKRHLQQAPYFENFEEFQMYLMRQTALDKEYLAGMLYLLFTNSSDGPELSELYGCLKNYMKEIIK